MDLSAFASAEERRAERTLDTARRLVHTDPDSAASRAYYAAFHALGAWFAREGRTFGKHSGIRAALHRDLIAAGRLGVEAGEDFDTLASLREVGDYGGLVTIGQDTAAATRFVTAIRRCSPERR